MRIAHLSDLHLLDLEGAVPMRLFNKRLTGYVNLRLKRGHHHKAHPVEAAARELRSTKIDHVVVTGDVSNLALEREFDRVRELLEGTLGLSPEDVSVVPGNHDAYTRGAVRSRRFARWFDRWSTTDLPEISDGADFPFVRLRKHVAFIGLSTAVARPPLVASGRLGAAQLTALRRALAHPEVRSRTVVLLQHHPIHNPPSASKALLEGLVDAEDELRAIEELERGLVLHGHLHRRMRRAVETKRGRLDAVGATSASLLHEDPDRMAGYNLYEVGTDGEAKILGARRFRSESHSFEDAEIPERSWH
jgi:3',5'-cyclic AMP phosphodiesterase CpdA